MKGKLVPEATGSAHRSAIGKRLCNQGRNGVIREETVYLGKRLYN